MSWDSTLLVCFKILMYFPTLYMQHWMQHWYCFDVFFLLVSQIAQLSKFHEGGSLGISLEGTVDIDDNGQEVQPHHYIRSIQAEGPVGQNGLLASGDELLEVRIVFLFTLKPERITQIWVYGTTRTSVVSDKKKVDMLGYHYSHWKTQRKSVIVVKYTVWSFFIESLLWMLFYFICSAHVLSSLSGTIWEYMYLFDHFVLFEISLRAKLSSFM